MALPVSPDVADVVAIDGSIILGDDPSTYQIDYDPPPAVQRWHGTPRFGHGNDITVLLAKDSNSTSDYIMGLLFLGIFTILFFGIWSIVLCSLKCCRHRCCGCCGSKRVLAATGNVSDFRDRLTAKGQNVFRIIFFLSCFGVTIFSFTLVQLGLAEIQQSISTIESVNEDIISIQQQITSDSTKLTSFTNQADILIRAIQQVFQNQDLSCPEVPGGEVLEAQMRQLKTTILNQIQSIQNLDADSKTIDLLSQVETALGEFNTTINDAVEAGETSNLQVRGLLIPLLLIPLYFISIMILGWVFDPGESINLKQYYYSKSDSFSDLTRHQKFHKVCYLITSWIVFPLFGLTILTTVLFGAAIPAVAVPNSDVCHGNSETPSVEATIGIILNQSSNSVLSGGNSNSLVRQTFDFYIGQCNVVDPAKLEDSTNIASQTENPLTFLEDYHNAFVSAQETLQGQISLLQDTNEQISQACSRISLGKPISKKQQLVGVLQNLKSTLGKVMTVISCPSIVPIYTTIVYQAVCDESIKGFSWSYASLFWISVFGMLLFTYRVSCLAYYAPFNQDSDDDDDDGNDGLDDDMIVDENNESYLVQHDDETEYDDDNDRITDSQDASKLLLSSRL